MRMPDSFRRRGSVTISLPRDLKELALEALERNPRYLDCSTSEVFGMILRDKFQSIIEDRNSALTRYCSTKFPIQIYLPTNTVDEPTPAARYDASFQLLTDYLRHYQRDDRLIPALVCSRADYGKPTPAGHIPKPTDLGNNIVSIGHPEENIVSDLILTKLSNAYPDLLERFFQDDSDSRSIIRDSAGLTLKPELINGLVTKDYGYLLVATSPYHADRTVSLIAGTGTLGTFASTKAAIQSNLRGLDLPTSGDFEVWVSCDVMAGLLPMEIGIEDVNEL